MQTMNIRHLYIVIMPVYVFLHACGITSISNHSSNCAQAAQGSLTPPSATLIYQAFTNDLYERFAVRIELTTDDYEKALQELDVEGCSTQVEVEAAISLDNIEISKPYGGGVVHRSSIECYTCGIDYTERWTVTKSQLLIINHLDRVGEHARQFSRLDKQHCITNSETVIVIFKNDHGKWAYDTFEYLDEIYL